MNQLRFDFSGARVLVTGGSNGIGLGIAGAFAYRPLDVREGAVIAQLAEGLDGLDVLVNNAGANTVQPATRWPEPCGGSSRRRPLARAERRRRRRRRGCGADPTQQRPAPGKAVNNHTIAMPWMRCETAIDTPK